MLVPVLTSLIVWLEAIFIKVYELYSLTGVVAKTRKCIPVREDDECDKYAINNRL